MTPMTRVLIMVLASLSAGIVAGFLLRRRGPLLRALDRSTMLAVYVLLFVLGLSVGANREVVTHLHELGAQAFVISILSVAGSLGAVHVVWVFWFTERNASGRHFGFSILDFGKTRHRGEVPPGGSSIQNPKSKIQNHEETAGGHMGPPLLRDLRSSGIVAAFFVGGIVAAASGLIPERVIALDPTSAVLVVLLLLVGVGMGSDARSWKEIRREGLRVFLVPGAIIVGTLLGAAAAALFLGAVTLPESLAVGCGFGYYSLSSILIKGMHLETLAVVALLSNIFREVFTLLFTPLLAHVLGPLAPIAAGGATSMDTMLPMVTRFSGKQYAVVSVISGVILSIACPVFITLILNVWK